MIISKHITGVILGLICVGTLRAQAPALPARGTLSQTLFTGKTFSNATAADTVVKPLSATGSYTLEVKARVNSATGRGLDIEARNKSYKGYRLTMDTAQLTSTNTLTTPQQLSAVKAGQEYLIRVAVNNDSAHIYQNGAYLLSKPLAQLKDIVNGVETDASDTAATGPNLAANWKGTATDSLGKPSAYGWAYTGYTGTGDIFNTANATSGVRYMDNTSGTSNAHTYNGAAWLNRLLFIRWDNATTQSVAYSYPVTLAANTSYEFSWLFGYISNATGNKTMTVGIGTTTAVADRFASRIFTTSGTRVFTKDNFTFTSQAAGVYYITITGDWALFSCADLQVRKMETTPRFIFGKNYPTGAVNMTILSATYDTAAYQPDAIVTTGTRQSVTLSGTKVAIPTTFNTDFTVPGKTDVHFTGENAPFVNSTVALNSSSAWLFLDNVKPSAVISNWLPYITINGQAAANGSNVRVAIYGNGAVVIPNGIVAQQKAITLYTGENYTGDSASYEIFTMHDSLGTWDNRFKSFRLKRGFSVTLGSNAQGLGFSKVYIADLKDVEVPVMPKGLYAKTSYIRAFQWDYVSKKGWAGGSTPVEQVNATWNYDWSASGNSTVNTQYTPIRQNAGWPDFPTIYNKQNSNHLLGFNEPDHTDQANMTVQQAIDQWPLLLKSGFRLGSPAPSSPNSWLKQFMDRADSLNYRVDFTAVHCYWNSRVSGGRADSWYSGLLSTYTSYGNKRPVWITEWNNGANWTGESWPTDTAAAFQKQLSELPLILQVFDTTSFVERYSIYNWVEDKRAMVLADTLTPAGRYYAANKSSLAYTSDSTVYKPADLFNHTWRIAAPVIGGVLTTDYKKVKLSWLDINGDLGTSYVLQRKRRTDTGYIQIGQFTLGTGYNEADTVRYTDSITYDTARYRLYAISYEGTQSWYSADLVWARDTAPQAAVLSGTAVAATQVNLSWTTATNARGYRLKRSGTRNGTYTVLADYITATTYQDKSAAANTAYYYTLSSLNSGGESANSDTVQITTPVLQSPVSVLHGRIASGDSKVTMTWDFQYDVKYKILRSATAAGTYDTIATGIDSLRYIDAGRTNNQQYYYKIAAYNLAGQAFTAALSAKPIQGQQLYISFDDTDSALAADTWGGYHAGFAASAVRATGYSGQALQLSGAADAYAALTYNGPVSGLHNFTAASWVKVSTLSSWMRVFDFGNSTTQYMFLTPQAGTSNGLSILRYGIKNGGDEQTISYNYSFPLNTWVHLAVAQSDTIVKLYVNGQVVATTTGITIRPGDLGITTLNYLGKSQFSDPLLNGAIDEFRMYNYALSDTNISRLASGLQPLSTLAVVPQNMTMVTAGNQPVAVYPNPFSTGVTVKLSSLAAGATVQVFNSAGALIKAAALHSATEYIALPALPAGMYYVHVSNGREQLTAKLVKE